MSTIHLSEGSVEPRRDKNLLRLYSMRFCPYAQRTRLVLKAKGIAHDTVNINLMKKPEWYMSIHPDGKVPALLDGNKIIVESLDICDYLEEKYPQNPLYPSDRASKEKDKQIIRKLEPVTSTFAKCLFGKEEKTPEEWVEELLVTLQPLEDELTARVTKFFGGEFPNMVDFMLWPWAERAGAITLKFGKKIPFKKDQIPRLCEWRKAMRENPVVSELYHGPEVYWRVAQFKLRNVDPDYDSILA